MARKRRFLDDPREGLGAVVEDPPQVAADEEAVGDRAERAERERVADAVVDDRRVLAVLLEYVRVLPERVRPLELGVEEAVRWVPGLDPGCPTDRHPRAA